MGVSERALEGGLHEVSEREEKGVSERALGGRLQDMLERTLERVLDYVRECIIEYVSQ